MAVLTIERKRPLVYTETRDPNASDIGYKRGTLWLNTTKMRAFICTANASIGTRWTPIGGDFIPLTASVSLTAPACVSLNTSGELIYGNAGTEATSRVIGFIPESIGEGEEGLVQVSGRYTFTGASFSGIGRSAFLAMVDGGISETPPSFGVGRIVKPVALILSATDIFISIQEGRKF